MAELLPAGKTLRPNRTPLPKVKRNGGSKLPKTCPFKLECADKINFTIANGQEFMLRQASHKRISVLLLFCLLICLLLLGSAHWTQAQGDDNQKKFVNAADPAFYYFGRVERRDSSLWTWPGTGLRVAYSGSPHVTLRFFADDFWETSSKGMAKAIWYRVDRGTWRRLPVGAGTTSDLPLVVPGDSNTHTLDVVKASEGRLFFNGILLEKFGTLQPAGVPPHKIEIVGDSISAGFRIYGLASYEVWEDHDAKASYGWLAGDQLNAEVRLIAITGLGLVHNFGLGPGQTKTIPAYYPFIDREGNNGNNWAAWQPEVIVVNVGTNDMTPPGNTPADQFQGAYINLLAEVRQFNPGAAIVALQPFGLDSGAQRVYPKEIAAAVAARRAAGDKRVIYVDTLGWLSSSDFNDGVHPNARGHARAASHLASVIRRLPAAPNPLPGS
ncbi:MAG: GDSL-type esterase/lipase family protein [Chloroflexota bacterium]